MKPEEYLDHLITRSENGLGQPSLLDEEVAASLRAAELLARTRQIPVPSGFTLRLEAEVRAHARMRQPSVQSGRFILPVHSQQRRSSQSALRRRPWLIAIGSAAILLIIFTCLLTVSFYNSSGNALSGSKPSVPTLTSSAQSRADEAIGQLENALIDLNSVVSAKRDSKTIKQAFNLVVTWTQNSQAAVASLPSASRFEATRQRLAARLTEETQTLSRLLGQVGWSMKVAFTQQLGLLGKTIPQVSHVTVETLGNGVLSITLKGSNFALQGQLVIDGKHMGSVSEITSSLLVAIVDHTWWASGTHMLGILNPDGTAAQIAYYSNRDGYQQPATPVATPTGRPHDD